MGNERTYSGVMGSLGRLRAALGANAEDLAHLDGPRLSLAKILDDADVLARQQAALTASKQEATKQFKALLVEAQRLASGMTRFLQVHYGTRSEKLAEFGLQPFRGRNPRTPKSPKSPADPTPALPAAHSGADSNTEP